jgi:DMSO/TMAO reductase YedYZ molybdopterin-dependent catalytic subunit
VARPASTSPDPAEFAGNQLNWEDLDSWLIPAHNFHYVTHFGLPEDLEESRWRLGVTALVTHPLSLMLADFKARPRREVDFVGSGILSRCFGKF